MTIKQLGGVFGRNPTFNDVTIEGTLTFDGALDITSDLTIGGNLTVSKTYGPVIKLESAGTGLGSGTVIGDIQFFGNDLSVPGAGIKAGIKVETVAALGDDAQMKFTTSDGATNNIDRMLIANNGDISFYEDTGTTAKLFWDASAESLGIGTTSPSTPIHVNSGTGNIAATFESTDAGSYINIIDNGSGAFGAMIGAVSDDIVFSPNNVEAMRIDSSGNVGIGTSSPSGLMSFAKGSRTLDLKLEDTAATGDVGIQLRAGSGDYFGIAAGGGTGVGIVIDDSNNVGIGTSSPALPLHVLNSSAALAYFESNSANGPYVIWRSAGTNIGDVGSAKGISGSGNATDFMIASRSTNPLILGTGSTERMRIDSSGKLLIGTTHNSLYNSSTQADAGLLLDGANDNLQVARYEGTPLFLNRMNTDGELLSFRKDGAPVGSIGTDFDVVYLANGSNFGIRIDDSGNGELLPTNTTGSGADGVADLGRSIIRWKDLYLSGGVNQSTVLVSALPAAASSTGYRFMVSDSTVAASGNFGATVAGSGSNVVPVFSDGTNWLIG